MNWRKIAITLLILVIIPFVPLVLLGFVVVYASAAEMLIHVLGYEYSVLDKLREITHP